MSEARPTHNHTHGMAKRTLRLAFFLTLLILAAEVTGGLLANSLALLSDAGHVLTDIFAIGLAWFATAQAERPANARKTFGYHRIGILAAQVNALTLILITVWILWEAISRFQHPEPVQPLVMFVSAGIGIAVNLLGTGLSMEASLGVKEARAMRNDVSRLSREQRKCFEVLERTDEHVFLTGRAGTGKSVLLEYFRDHTKKRVIVVAPTGIAALNIGGQTIHSLFRLPLGFIGRDALTVDMRLSTLLRYVDTVVIDEISMVRADLLDAIDTRLRQAYGNVLP